MTDRIEFITTGRAGRRLGCTPQTIARLVRRGHLRGIKLPGSGQLRVYRQDIENVIAEGASAAAHA